MARNFSRRNAEPVPPVYIYELPYATMRELCKILDIQEGWAELGGTHMNFDILTLNEFRQARHSGSPSYDMLTKWGQRNGRITTLFRYLSKMGLNQAMRELKPYVPATYVNKCHQYEQPNSTWFSSTDMNQVYDKKSISKEDKPPSYPGSQSYRPVLDTLSTIGLNLSHKLSVAVDPQRKSPVEEHAPPYYGTPGNEPFSIPVNGRVNGSYNLNQNSKDSVLPPQMSPSASNEPHRLPVQSMDMYNTNLVDQRPTIPPGTTSDSGSLDKKNAAEMCTRVVEQKIEVEGESPSNDKCPQNRKMSGPDSIAAEFNIRTIPYEQIVNGTQNFSTKELGRGGFGTVFLGVWKNTPVAIKRVQRKNFTAIEEQKIEQSLKELTADILRHDNIVLLYGYSLNDKGLFLVYQLMAQGSLEDRLQCKDNSTPLNWSQRLHICRGAACGIQYVHTVGKKPFIHGDIKSANILLDANMEPKLADFGLIREGPDEGKTHTHVQIIHGTKAYLPLEFLQSHTLSTKVDTYSFGVVLFEIATGQRAIIRDSKKKPVDLTNCISSCDPQKLDQWRDKKAGNEHCDLFHLFMGQGKRCTEHMKGNRPEMTEVFQLLDNRMKTLEIKVKAEKKGLSSMPTPLELQRRFDMEQQNYQQDRVAPLNFPMRHGGIPMDHYACQTPALFQQRESPSRSPNAAFTPLPQDAEKADLRNAAFLPQYNPRIPIEQTTPSVASSSSSSGSNNMAPNPMLVPMASFHPPMMNYNQLHSIQPPGYEEAMRGNYQYYPSHYRYPPQIYYPVPSYAAPSLQQEIKIDGMAAPKVELPTDNIPKITLLNVGIRKKDEPKGLEPEPPELEDANQMEPPEMQLHDERKPIFLPNFDLLLQPPESVAQPSTLPTPAEESARATEQQNPESCMENGHAVNGIKPYLNVDIAYPPAADSLNLQCILQPDDSDNSSDIHSSDNAPLSAKGKSISFEA